MKYIGDFVGDGGGNTGAPVKYGISDSPTLHISVCSAVAVKHTAYQTDAGMVHACRTDVGK